MPWDAVDLGSSTPLEGRCDAYESRDAEEVSEVYEQLGSFIGTERVATEVTGWPAGIAAGLLVLAGLAAWRFGPRLS